MTRQSVETRTGASATAAAALALIALTSLLSPVSARAELRETRVATQFQVFVPANNDTGTRYSSIVITAMSGTDAEPCVVDLVDDGADGDTDDSMTGVVLRKGESLVRYIREGSVNDDMGGKWDGDYMRVSASLPVSVLIGTDSDWQHDWAPSDNGTLRGNRFFLFGLGYAVSQQDVDVFAYEADTRVELYDVTATVRTSSGVATVKARPTDPVMSATLAQGEDLLVRRGLGRDVLARGRTYELVASKPVTVLYGSISSVLPQNQARDGAGYVPGRTGSALDDDFYFHIPHNPGTLSEQELRIVAVQDGVAVTLEAFDAALGAYKPIRTYSLNRLQHADYVGGTYELYRLRSTGGRVVVFEANWMETGSAGTSDDADYVPGLFTATGGQDFLVYVGPPGRQTNTTFRGTFSHVILAARTAAANVRVYDADTGGTLFDRTVSVAAGGYVDVQMTEAQYNSLNRAAVGIRPYLRVASPVPISVATGNFNDNWLAYASAVVTRNPEVTLSGPSNVQPGASAAFSGSVTNEGSATLDDVSVRVSLPSGVDYVSGTLGGQAQTSVTSQPQSTEVTFDLPSLAPNQSASLEVVVSVRPGAASSGEILNLDVAASADGGDVVVASTASQPTTYRDPVVASVSGLAALSGDRSATISYQLTGAASRAWIEWSTSASGTFTKIAASEVSFGGNASATTFSYVQTSLANNTPRYYRVVAVPSGAVDTSVQASDGPVVVVPTDTVAPPAPTARAVPGDRSAAVTCAGSSGGDFVGYVVERSTNGTSWTVLTASPTAVMPFVSSGLANEVTYSFRCKAVDDDNNASAYSATATARPSAFTERSTDRVLYYEDLLGSGENDWDYNDFIVRTHVVERMSSAGVSRVTFAYEPLARGAGYVHRVRQALPVRGAWTARLSLFFPSGTVVTTTNGSGAIDLVVFDDTRDVLPSTTDRYTNTSATQTAFEPGVPAELVLDLDPTANADGSFGAAPYDLYVELPYLRGENEVHRARYGGAVEQTERASSLTGYPLDFVLETSSADAIWPFEGEPIWRSFPSFVNFVRSGAASDYLQHPSSSARVFDERRGR